MKKTLLFLTLIFAIFAGNTQSLLYEGFAYPLPAYIGGNGDAGTSSNNWTTHSVTVGQTTTIDLIAGSLSYSGIATPTGDKLSFFSNANATSRDVNSAFSTTSTTAYYSVLVNIVDNSQISASTFDYFMAFGGASGSSVTVLGARLGIKSVNTGANFRFGIGNTSGGTLTYTEFAQDLNFGTTYLVVVKYDINVAPTVASLWVNPTSLGGAEPAGSITNNVGTGTFATLASICLRNNSVSPKAEIDEIRVGTTWASVTPATTGIKEISNENEIKVYPNPAANFVTISAKETISNVNIYDFQGRIVSEYDFNGANDIKLNISELANGIYSIVANTSNGKSFSSKLIK